ncbi:MAG: VOC family protein [Rhodospirillaceae bacterium]|nr:VOC family protein [Rhodospirillaceae bacterium]
MRTGIQGLGWFVRRSADPRTQMDFYLAALGLPSLRRWSYNGSAGAMLRAGDVGVFELGALDPTAAAAPPADPAQAECTPVFRARDMTAALDRAVAAGARVAADTVDGGLREVLLTDPLGYPFSFLEADPASLLAHDAAAERAWRSPPAAMAALPPMPPAIQDIARVRLRVEQPQALAAFYVQTVGLDTLLDATAERALLHLGGTCALELVAGGARREPPKDRTEIPDVWILRVYDYVGIKAHFAVHDVRTVNTVDLTGGWLDYCADPEGRLFGYQERRPPDPAIPNSQLIEDAAARAVWEGREASGT